MLALSPVKRKHCISSHTLPGKLSRGQCSGKTVVLALLLTGETNLLYESPVEQ